MKITTNEFFIFSRRDIRKGGIGVITTEPFADEARAKLLISDRLANGESLAGDEFAARAEIDYSHGNVEGWIGGPVAPAQVFRIFRPVQPLWAPDDAGDTLLPLIAGLVARSEDPSAVTWFDGNDASAVGKGFGYVRGKDLTIAQAHYWICHSNGSTCEDGCDVAALPGTVEMLTANPEGFRWVPK